MTENLTPHPSTQNQQGTSMSSNPSASSQIQVSQAKKPNTKKIVFGCFGSLLGLLALLTGLSIAFLGNIKSYTTPLADAFGLEPVTVVQGVTIIGNIFFILLGILVFVLTIVSLFKYVTTKKEDPTKKKFLWKIFIYAIALILTLAAWAVMYFYLSAKSVVVSQPKPKPPIHTEPEQTLNLTAPIEIAFDASGTSYVIDLSRYKIISYVWDFGDNETGTGVKVSHLYKNKGKNNGQFEVKLALNLLDQSSGKIVKNQNFKTIISIANVRTSALFTAIPDRGAPPLKVDFDASESYDPDGEIVRYEWDFDEDGNYSDAVDAKASYTFEKEGDFKVSLRITDNSGQYAVSEKLIKVSNEFSLQAAISVIAEPNGKFLIKKKYLFDGSNSKSPDSIITKYEWDMGDGSTVRRSKTLSYAYNQEGIYEVKLTITDEKGSTTTQKKKIVVGNPPQTPKAIIETTPEKNKKGLIGAVPFEVKFDATSSTDPDENIIQYRWDFNNDGTDDQFGPVVSYIFDKEGVYRVTLNVEDVDDNIATENILVTVNPPGLIAKVIADPVSGVVPLLVTFDASGSTYLGGQIISYEWDFGDKTPKRQDAAKLSYKYNNVGTYTASVTAIGADGKRDSESVLVTVQVVPVKACFEVSKHEGVAPFEGIFTSKCSTGTISKYRWDFNGDGIYNDASQPNVTYTFKDAGTYKVSLEVTDQQGVVDIFIDEITVTEP